MIHTQRSSLLVSVNSPPYIKDVIVEKLLLFFQLIRYYHKVHLIWLFSCNKKVCLQSIGISLHSAACLLALKHICLQVGTIQLSPIHSKQIKNVKRSK